LTFGFLVEQKKSYFISVFAETGVSVNYHFRALLSAEVKDEWRQMRKDLLKEIEHVRHTVSIYVCLSD